MAAEPPELAEGTTPAARVRELERELRLMGPINPLALEEFDALQERHTFLQEQLDDVKGSRRDLAKVIKAIDDEIVDVFAGAFADVSQNFESLFETLFPGGQGRLRLTDPDDLLETGIEVEAKPSGKNVRKLSLLSGGERSLTALAFLFAVFRSRPSPFYVMDEVEAALDDVNLHRFLDLVHEFREEAQLLIVSHQKRTMEAADCSTASPCSLAAAARSSASASPASPDGRRRGSRHGHPLRCSTPWNSCSSPSSSSSSLAAHRARRHPPSSRDRPSSRRRSPPESPAEVAETSRRVEEAARRRRRGAAAPRSPGSAIGSARPAARCRATWAPSWPATRSTGRPGTTSRRR